MDTIDESAIGGEMMGMESALYHCVEGSQYYNDMDGRYIEMYAFI
jgi:hypothetical protein